MEDASVCVSIGRRAGRTKDTSANIEASGEFIVNVVDEAFAGAMNMTSGEYEPEVDESAIVPEHKFGGRPVTRPSTFRPATFDPEAEILVEQEGAVGTITLNRPAVHNALRYAMWRDLAAGVRDLAGREGVRVIVVRGAGERTFSAGADIAEFPERRGTIDAAAAYHAAVEDASGAITGVAQPVIAMIHGYCIGGGCELAIACDLRIADDQARFGIPAAKLGVILGLGELRQLLALVGPATAKDILFTGRLLGADEALRVGLVDRVVPAAELAGTVTKLAAQIGANAPIAVAATKALLAGLTRGDDPADLARVQATFVRQAFASTDHGEGTRAFLEKRPPQFRGQ